MQHLANDFNRKVKKINVGLVAVFSIFVLTACGSNKASNSGTSNLQTAKSSGKTKNNSTGTVTNTPTTLADFTATVKAAGYTIVSGQDPYLNNISGSVEMASNAGKQDNNPNTKDETEKMYYANITVRVSNHTSNGSIAYYIGSKFPWMVSFDDDSINWHWGGIGAAAIVGKADDNNPVFDAALAKKALKSQLDSN